MWNMLQRILLRGANDRKYFSVVEKCMRVILYEKGGPEKLFVGNAPIPELKKRHVLVKVYATALNRADVLQRQGRYPPPPGESEILGLEAVGVVDKVDQLCQKWKEGDRVMSLLPGGGYAEYVSVHEDLVMTIPEGMSYRDAAAIPEAWLTAYQLLHFVGAVKSGDNVLIHAAASGVGLAAIQLVKLASANAFVTVGSSEKLLFALELGATEGFNYKTGPFSDGLLAATQGHGVDLILDCVGGSYWDQNAKVLAVDGHWILYGLLGGPKVDGNLFSHLLAKRSKLEGTTLRSRSLQYKTELVQSFSEKILPLFKSGALKPVVDCDFPFGRIVEAHQYMEENRNLGKIVLLVRNLESDGVHEEP